MTDNTHGQVPADTNAASGAAEPGAMQAATLSAYAPADQAFYKFWYGHMLADLMQPPLVGMSHTTARYIWDAALASAPAQPVAQPSHEHQRAIMEGERNASLDAYSRVVHLTSAESRLYESAFTSGWDRRDRLASYGQAPAQAAPAAVAGPSDLRARCEEILAWLKTGILPGDALRTLAREKYGDEYDAIQRAERDTETEALNFVIAAPTPQPAPQQEAQGDALDAARYRFLRDCEWRDTDLEPFIRLQLNMLWDAKIDAARAAQEGK